MSDNSYHRINLSKKDEIVLYRSYAKPMLAKKKLNKYLTVLSFDIISIHNHSTVIDGITNQVFHDIIYTSNSEKYIILYILIPFTLPFSISRYRES